MANFHDDEWIMSKVQEHYNETLQYFNANQIIGVFLFGSQNYCVDTEDSDIDTKALLIPSNLNIYIEEKHLRANDEIIFFLDIRHLINGIKCQLLDYIDILFSKYFILNPQYETLWLELIALNNRLTNDYNPHKLMNQFNTWNHRYYNAMIKNPPEPRRSVVQKYGYDHKQLYYLMLLYQQLKCYLAGFSYGDVYNDIFSEELIKAKTRQYTIIEAQALAQFLYTEINHLTKTHYLFDYTNPLLDEKLDDILLKFLAQEV